MREENLHACRWEMGNNEFSWSGLKNILHNYGASKSFQFNQHDMMNFTCACITQKCAT